MEARAMKLAGLIMYKPMKRHLYGSEHFMRTACGRRIDEVDHVHPARWFQEHPYPEVLEGHVCKQCEKTLKKGKTT